MKSKTILFRLYFFFFINDYLMQYAQQKSYFSNYRSEMRRYLPLSFSKVLDVGCGEGKFLDYLSNDNSKEIWGIEINPNAASSASEIYFKVLNSSVEHSIESLPDNYFDCIVFNDVLEHLAYPENVLAMIKSKLSDNGVVVASIPNVRFVTNLYKLILKKSWEYTDEGILDRTHLRFFTKSSINNMFERTGYQIKQLEGINPIRHSLFGLFNLISLGMFADTRFLQFAVVASQRRGAAND